jgi:hypothetical protein
MTPRPMFRARVFSRCDGRNLFQIETPTFRLETALRPPRRAPFLVWALAFAVFVVIVGVVLLASVRGWLPSAQRRRDKRQ